jgi:hypothetical protein
MKKTGRNYLQLSGCKVRTLASGLLLLLVMWLGSGCGPGICVDAEELTYKITRDDSLKKNKRGRVVVDLVNRSDRFLLVERISGPHIAAGMADSLLGSEPGSLEPLEDGSGYFFNMLAQQETPAVMSRGLLPPGQRLRMEVMILPKKDQGVFKVYYRGLDSIEAVRHLFFPAELQDGRFDYSRLIRLTQEDLQAILATQPENSDQRQDAFALVVVSEAMAREPARCEVELPYKFSFTKKKPAE